MLDIQEVLSINTEVAFRKATLDVFRHQSIHCKPYRDYLAALGVDAKSITTIEQIPHIPIELFKSLKVYCGATPPEATFTSSTTSGDSPAYHHIETLNSYRATLRKAFSTFYGEPSGWSFYALLPCYLEREGSSLVWMADDLIKNGGGGFFLNDLRGLIDAMAADNKPKILLGVSYALLDLAEQFAPKLSDTIVMETGGMKGRRTELPKAEFHNILCNAFGVEKIHSEYGMAELTSQAYSNGDGIFRTPPWMRVSVRDFNDPFETLGAGRHGGINIIDLGNLHSCSFIETQDAGIVFPDGSFSISGRIAKTQTRGCNLMVD